MKKRRGLMLIEMVATLTLMAAAAILMTELFVSSTRAIRNADQRRETAWRYEQMIATLRRDVSSSLMLHVKSATELEIDCGRGDKRRWIITADTLTRTVGGQSRVWNQAPSDMTFETRGRTAVLKVPAAAGDVMLASPALLAGELQR